MSCPAFAQTGETPEYVSPAGVKYYAQKDDHNTVAEAEISAMLANTADARAFAASKNG